MTALQKRLISDSHKPLGKLVVGLFEKDYGGPQFLANRVDLGCTCL
jgi:hypothetical protein